MGGRCWKSSRGGEEERRGKLSRGEVIGLGGRSASSKNRGIRWRRRRSALLREEEVREVVKERCEVEERNGGVTARGKERCYVGITAETSGIW